MKNSIRYILANLKYSKDIAPSTYFKAVLNGIRAIFMNTFLFLVALVRQYPIRVLAVMLIFTVFYLVIQLGKARSERDAYSKRSIELLDSIHKLNRQPLSYVNYR